MLSKLFTRLNHTQNMMQYAQRSFRATPQVNKKPSIGDAVTILQSKVSNISQVVSISESISRPFFLSRICVAWILTSHIKYYRTIWKNSVLWSQLVMVLPESSVWPRSKQERWLSSAVESRVWLSTWKLIMLVLSSSVTIGKPPFRSHYPKRDSGRRYCQENWIHRGCTHRRRDARKSRRSSWKRYRRTGTNQVRLETKSRAQGTRYHPQKVSARAYANWTQISRFTGKYKFPLKS